MINIPVEPKITEYLHNKASMVGIPLNGTFELTPLCNMNCRMCYIRMDKEKQESIHPLISAKQWIELGKEIKDKGMLYLLITGGEPFLRNDLRDILTELQKIGLVITINTNATLIDEKTISWLKKCPPSRLNITLYGASNETYARLCNNPKGFDQVKHAIHLLKDIGIAIKLNCSVTPYNVDDLEKIIEFAKEEKLIIQPTSYMFPPLRKNKHLIGQNDRFTPEEAAYYSAKIERLLNGDELFLEKMKRETSLSLNTDNEECGEGDIIRCRAGKCSFWITWDGRLLPCGMFPQKGISVFDEGFEKAWNKTKNMVNYIRLPAKCHYCSIKDQCRVCAAMVITESGSFDTVPQYRCDMAHAYLSACKIMEREILDEKNKG